MSRFAHTRLAGFLMALAGRLAPRDRRDWSEAMRSEFDYLPVPARLRWAFGCVIAAAKLRLVPMQTGSLRINRWVLLVEMLACFAPTTLAWWEFTVGPSGVSKLNGEIIDKYFMGSPLGQWALVMMIVYAVTGLVGPIGLFLGLRFALLGRALLPRFLGWTLIAPILAQCVASTVWLLWIGKGDVENGVQMFVLLTVLPVIGILHLLYLSRRGMPGGAWRETDGRLT